MASCGGAVEESAIPTLEGPLDQVLGELSQTLGSYPRRVSGRVVVSGIELRYVDLHSFYWQAVQIFAKRFYDFDAEVPDPVIIDGGAHIGLASLSFAMRYPQARIDAFEADPAIAEVLVANLRSAGAANVTCHASGLWTHDQGMGFVRSHDDSGHVAAESDAVVETIATVRLRDLLQGQARPVDLLKLDVEGAEFALVEDCDGALGGVRRIIAEVHCLGQPDASLSRLLATLERNGFRCALYDLNPADWLPCAEPPPFAALRTGKFLVTVYAWR